MKRQVGIGVAPICRPESKRRAQRSWQIVALFLLVTAWAVVPGWAAGTKPRRSSPLNLSGQSVNPLRPHHASITVLIFIRTDCPVSSRYAPEIQRLDAEFERRGVEFWLVDPDPTESAAAIRQYLKAYGYAGAARVLRDPAHVLVRQTGVTITPEAAVFTQTGQLAYRGRIDNWFVTLGKARPAPTTHDLQAALNAVLAGKPVAEKTTPAVGCFIADMQ